jgi:hypothetical protein
MRSIATAPIATVPIAMCTAMCTVVFIAVFIAVFVTVSKPNRHDVDSLRQNQSALRACRIASLRTSGSSRSR